MDVYLSLIHISTSLPGQVTQTSPYGRDVETVGYPIRVSELLASLDGPESVSYTHLDVYKRQL